MKSNFFETPFSSIKFFNIPSKTKNPLLGIFVIVSIAILFSISNSSFSFAESQTIPLNDEINLEATTVLMSIPEDNVMPWGSVRGTINDPAIGYPVIIQFFSEENGDIPIHVAQVEINDDNTFEYKFRVRDVDLNTGKAINIFEGVYSVKIFKVVNTPTKELETI